MTFLYWFKQQWAVSGSVKAPTMAIMFQGIQKLNDKDRNRLAGIIESGV
jgi:hypothetical protein